MSIVKPHVTNLVGAGGAGGVSPTTAAYFAAAADMWPRDRVLVAGGITIELRGDASWCIADPTTGESLVDRAPNIIPR